MLALVARLGTFGISVLLATHLLDDVQQVCDNVVMIDGGRSSSPAPPRALERTGMVVVDVGARGDELVAALAPRGMHAAVVDGTVEIDGRRRGRPRQDPRRDRRSRAPAAPTDDRLTSLDDVFLAAPRSTT